MPVHLDPFSLSNFGGSGTSRHRRNKLTRRSFLAICAAGCTGAKLPKRPAVPAVWALVSDTHIDESPERVVRGSNMAANLRGVIEDLLEASPDAVIFNGDMACAEGNSGDYAAFNEIALPITKRRIPAHFTLGNHDHRERFLEAFKPDDQSPVHEKFTSRIASDDFDWLLLDSLQTTNAIRGSLGETQLDWLARTLDARQDRPAIIMLHHNPEHSVVGLTDTSSFLNVVRPRRQVKAVIFGHTHEYRVWTDHGIHFINLPATGYRFSTMASLGWIVARIRPGEIELVFHALDPGDPMHHAARTLAWRAAREGGR